MRDEAEAEEERAKPGGGKGRGRGRGRGAKKNKVEIDAPIPVDPNAKPAETPAEEVPPTQPRSPEKKEIRKLREKVRMTPTKRMRTSPAGASHPQSKRSRKNKEDMAKAKDGEIEDGPKAQDSQDQLR